MSAKREPVYEGNPCVIFVDGLAAVIPLGSVTHLLFTAREAQLSEGGKIARNGQVRLIVPADCLQEIANTILRGERNRRAMKWTMAFPWWCLTEKQGAGPALLARYEKAPTGILIRPGQSLRDTDITVSEYSHRGIGEARYEVLKRVL